MWTGVSLVLVVFLHACQGEKVCGVSGSQCQVLEDNLNQKWVQSLHEWWRRLSVQKPIKCQGAAAFDVGELDTKKSVPILVSTICHDKESFRKHAFVGEIDSLGQYQGPGKFKLDDDSGVSSAPTNVCFQRSSLVGNLPVNITGKFKDGIPHGTLKVDTTNNDTFVGRFVEGTPHGPIRKWSPNKVLSMFGYMRNSTWHGTCWSEHEGHLIQSNCGVLGTWEETKEEILVIINNTVAIAGIAYVWQHFVDEAQFVKLESVEESDCYMSVKYSKLPGVPFRYNLGTNEFLFPDEPEYPHCPFTGEWNSEHLAKRTLGDWYNPLSDITTENIWKYRESSLPLASDAPKVIADIQAQGNGIYSCRVMGLDRVFLFSVRSGFTDKRGLFQGTFNFEFDEGIPEPLFDARWNKIQGVMKDNVPQNAIMFHYTDGRILSGRIKEGVLHGMISLYGLRGLLPLAQEFGYTILDRANSTKGHGVAGIFNIINGQPSGHFWLRFMGNGILYGEFDAHGHFTGDNLAFVMPNMKLAYVGRFEDMVMKEARLAHVIGERCDQFGIKELQFGEPSGPVLFYSPPTNISFGEGPRVSDPYEDLNVEVRDSAIPNSGQGLYALLDIPEWTTFCFYAGYNYRNDEERYIYANRYAKNESLSMDARRQGLVYGISTESTASSINLPPEIHGRWNWHPTVGHKAQSDFNDRAANGYFTDTEHPRFGMIIGLVAKRDIVAGEEILIDYGYQQGPPPYDFPWYFQSKAEFLAQKETDKDSKEMTVIHTDEP